jgi:uncharacterized membrane protein
VDFVDFVDFIARRPMDTRVVEVFWVFLFGSGLEQKAGLLEQLRIILEDSGYLGCLGFLVRTQRRLGKWSPVVPTQAAQHSTRKV